MLDRLKQANYNTVLLDNADLGMGQTGHSHCYIHRGHMFVNAESVKYTKNAAGLWDTWREASNYKGDEVDSYFIYRSDYEEKAQKARVSWELAELVTKDGVAPTTLSNKWTTSFEVPTQCLPWSDLAQHFLSGHRNSVCRIRSIEDIQKVDRGVKLICVTADGQQGTLYANTLVLAAGSGNVTLASMILEAGQVVKASSEPLCQEVCTFMLAISGPKDLLPTFTGMLFPIGFIATRTKDGKNCWLVSDRLDQFFGLPNPTKAEWLRGMVPAIQEAFPILRAQPETFEWTCFEAKKTEGSFKRGKLPPQVTLRTLSNDRKVWVVYPNLFTFALAGADELLVQLDNPGSSTDGFAGWSNFQNASTIKAEQWDRSSYENWDDFQARFVESEVSR